MLDPNITTQLGRVGFFKPPDSTAPRLPTTKITNETSTKEAKQELDHVRQALQRLKHASTEDERTVNLAHIERAVARGSCALNPKMEAPRPPPLTMEPVEYMMQFLMLPLLIWDPCLFWPHLVSMPKCWKCKSDAKVHCDGWAARSRRVRAVLLERAQGPLQRSRSEPGWQV